MVLVIAHVSFVVFCWMPTEGTSRRKVATIAVSGMDISFNGHHNKWEGFNILCIVQLDVSQYGKHVTKGRQTIKFGSKKNNSMVPVEKGPTIGKAFPCVKNWLFISPHWEFSSLCQNIKNSYRREKTWKSLNISQNYVRLECDIVPSNSNIFNRRNS